MLTRLAPDSMSREPDSIPTQMSRVAIDFFRKTNSLSLINK